MMITATITNGLITQSNHFQVEFTPLKLRDKGYKYPKRKTATEVAMEEREKMYRQFDIQYRRAVRTPPVITEDTPFITFSEAINRWGGNPFSS